MKDIINNAKSHMEKSLESLAHELSAIRAGRANPAILDSVKVDYYGVPTAINGMSSISVSEARILIIQPWDASALKLIEKAIAASDIGVNPSNDGKAIRIAFPQLTEERRKELVKKVKHLAENGKVAVRNIRRDAIDALKKAQKSNELTEDDLKTAEKDIQKITDGYIKKIDDASAEKEKEVMTV